MKRSIRNKSGLLLIILGVLSATTPSYGDGNADPNYLLAFKKLYLEPVQDNIDGALQAPVEQSYKEIFDRNPRFELVTEKAHADTIVRTVLDKKTNGIDINISLILAGTGELFTTEHDSVGPQASGRETGTKVKQLLKAALKRIPFYGSITGRDGNELTFDIGGAHGLRKHDVVQISRIDNIKRHPLLKSIVDVQLIPVGSAVVDSVEETIAFGHVKNEITGETIQKLHKVTAIEARMADTIAAPAPDPLSGAAEQRDSRQATSDAPPRGETDDRPHIGYVALGVQLSSFSSTSSQNTGTPISGGGFNPGARLSTEVWLTKRWFADMTLGASTVSYSQSVSGATTPTTAFSTSTRVFGIDAGYKYLPDGNLYGPQVSAKLGYASYTWSTPVSPADLLSSKSYVGINLGVGGVLPLATYDWGLMMNVNVMLFPGLTEDTFKVVGPSGSASGTTFFLGGYHYFNPKVAVRSGVNVEIFSANDSSGGSSTSQKTFGLLTSVLYYF